MRECKDCIYAGTITLEGKVFCKKFKIKPPRDREECDAFRARKCRWCKHYRPDERFCGVIGYCENHKRATSVIDACADVECGTQRCMNGKEVKE